MSNFGYFQLKANPGVFDLHLKPNSRSSELFDVIKPPPSAKSIARDARSKAPLSYFMREIDPSIDIAESSSVVVDDFNGYFQFLRVNCCFYIFSSCLSHLLLPPSFVSMLLLIGS